MQRQPIALNDACDVSFIDTARGKSLDLVRSRVQLGTSHSVIGQAWSPNMPTFSLCFRLTLLRSLADQLSLDFGGESEDGGQNLRVKALVESHVLLRDMHRYALLRQQLQGRKDVHQATTQTANFGNDQSVAKLQLRQ